MVALDYSCGPLAGKAARTLFSPKLLLPFLLVAALSPSGVPAQELGWATRAGDAAFIAGFGIATDPRGNSYVTGGFSDTATFGAGEANETVLTEMPREVFFLGISDIFVAKYAGDGSLLWATSAGGGGYSASRGIATDAPGNSYVTGNFEGTMTFGAGEANETVLEGPNGCCHVFVAKYAADGTLVWATSTDATTGFDGEAAFAIAADPRGNSYVTGGFSDTATFGAGEANETVLEAVSGFDQASSPNGDDDMFVAKYDRNGSLLWATSAGGGAATVYGTRIATDPRGNSYVTGFNDGTATFGAGEANETVLESGGFVAKYARDGSLLWATRARDAGFGGIATDPRGNSYVIGGFSDMFVSKFASNGTLLSATGASSTGQGFGFAIATDPRGNSYVTGGFSDTATFGAGEANETVLTSLGISDIFVAKYVARAGRGR